MKTANDIERHGLLAAQGLDLCLGEQIPGRVDEVAFERILGGQEDVIRATRKTNVGKTLRLAKLDRRVLRVGRD